MITHTKVKGAVFEVNRLLDAGFWGKVYDRFFKEVLSHFSSVSFIL